MVEHKISKKARMLFSYWQSILYCCLTYCPHYVTFIWSHNPWTSLAEVHNRDYILIELIWYIKLKWNGASLETRGSFSKSFSKRIWNHLLSPRGGSSRIPCNLVELGLSSMVFFGFWLGLLCPIAPLLELVRPMPLKKQLQLLPHVSFYAHQHIICLIYNLLLKKFFKYIFQSDVSSM